MKLHAQSSMGRINKIGGTPAKSGKTHCDLSLNLPASYAVKEVLKEQLEVFNYNCQGAILGNNIEYLHHFRVACRRSRSILNQMKKVFPEQVIKPFQEEFAWLSCMTGMVRDLDVLILKMQGSELKDDFKRNDLKPLMYLIHEIRKKEQRFLRKGLESERFKIFLKSWKKFLNQKDARNQISGIRNFSNKKILKLYKRILKEGQIISDEDAQSAFHELRKTCKKLRYLLEAFHPLYTVDQFQDNVKSLKSLQQFLGLINDNYFQYEFMEQLLLLSDLPDSTRKLIIQKAESYDNDYTYMIDKFSRVFSEFSSPSRQRNWGHIFHD